MINADVEMKVSVLTLSGEMLDIHNGSGQQLLDNGGGGRYTDTIHHTP